MQCNVCDFSYKALFLQRQAGGDTASRVLTHLESMFQNGDGNIWKGLLSEVILS